MSFNRLKYDNCAYSKELQESTSPLEYQLFRGKFENCKQCPVGSYTNNLEFGAKTSVESELFGLTRQESKCPDKKFNPKNPGPKADYSPPQMCQSIYHITPTNMKMPSSNGLNEKALGTNCCPAK
jgi:hypothetical protein